MGSNFAARAATSPELTKFLTPGDGSILDIAIQHPVTVYTARINQTFDSLDGVVELTYDTGSGTLEDVLAGMTVFIGSTAGARDKGICRVRKLPTSDKLYINQNSKIQFADNDHLTVVNWLQLWQRDYTMNGGILRMDYDIESNDYRHSTFMHRIAPIVAVLHLADGVDDVVTFTPPDPTDSASYNGATIASYLYEAPGAASTADMDTDHPSWTYDAAGEYLWTCTITDSNGVEHVSHRWVFVDPAKIPFTFEDCGGELDSGDWSFTFTCFEDVAESEVYDRALVTLYSTDYYGAVKGSIGKIEGYENIWASGWIDGDSTTYDSETGEVTFTVRGPGYWMSKLRVSPINFQDVSGAPVSWNEITEMTADKALATLLYWTSTAPLIMDCYFSGDTTRHKIFSLPGGNLFDQIDAIAGKIFAVPLCNSYGQMYVEIDNQLISSAERASLPVVMDMTKAHRKDGLTIERATDEVSMVELSVTTYDGTTLSQVYSRAPGNTGSEYGDLDAYDDYVLSGQDECNRVAGCLLAMRNGEFEPIEITFPALIRLFDICPRMVATLTVLAADNPRGIALTAAGLIPRAVKYIEDDSGIYSTQVTFEAETTGVDGVTYVPPVVSDNGIEDYELSDFGNIDFPNSDLGSYFPDAIPAVLPPASCGDVPNTFQAGAWDVSAVYGTGVRISKLYFPCKLRPASATNKSLLDTRGHFFGDAITHYNVYGVKNGTRVVTATVAAGIANFAPVSAIDIDYFELEIDSGLGSSTIVIPQDQIASGTVAANDSVGDIITTVVGQYYALEETGGTWEFAIPNPSYRKGARLSDSPGDTDNALYAELIAGTRYRKYYLAATNPMRALINTTSFIGNTGSISYAVRNALIKGRQIDLNTGIVNNVCGAG